MAAVLYSLKTVLIQFDGSGGNLVQAFEDKGVKHALREEFSFYNRKGLDEVHDKSKVQKIGGEEIYDNVIQVRHTNLYYMPASKRSKAQQEKEFEGEFLLELLRGLTEFNGIHFFDCISGFNQIQELLFQESDVIAVNICQGQENIDEFMEYRQLREKAVFIVGRYDRESRENLANIRRRYNIARDSIGIIPYNIHFHDALCEGRLVPFVGKAIFHRKTDEDYDFIASLFETTNMVLRRAGYDGI